jgi:hypothetical protein
MKTLNNRNTSISSGELKLCKQNKSFLSFETLGEKYRFDIKSFEVLSYGCSIFNTWNDGRLWLLDCV